MTSRPAAAQTFANMAMGEKPESSDTNHARGCPCHRSNKAIQKFVQEHQHAACGLFAITELQVPRTCPSCSRRSNQYDGREAYTLLQQQLKFAKRNKWSQSSIDHIEKQLEEEDNGMCFDEAIYRVLYPFVECEGCHEDDVGSV